MTVLLRRRKKRSRERGVALILVLGALTILTVMLTDFQDETSAELGSALSARDGLKAEYAARSAVSLSRLLISAEPTIRKAIAPLFMLMGGPPPQIPVWQFADQVLGAFNDTAGQAKFSALASVNMEKGKKLGMEGAGFDIEILDEDSKIDLNNAWRDPLTQTRLAAQIMGLISPLQYEPLFTSRDGDGQYSDRMQICGAMIDWADANQDMTTCDMRSALGPSSAPEDSFYQMLDPPYFRKNAPFDSLEELHNVRGISDDFWSTFIDPDPNDASRRNVTVWGTGKVNVNTANAQTLLAVVCGGATAAKMCIDPLEGAKFVALVNMIRMFTMGAPVFSSANGFINTLKQQSPIGLILKSLNLEPVIFSSEAEVKKAITAESKVFTIIATGRVKSGQRDSRVRINAVVDFRSAPTPAQLLANVLPPGAAAALGLGGAPGTGAAGSPGTGIGGGLGGLGLTGDATNALPYTGFQPGQLPANAPPGATVDGALAYLMPNPGGRIVYFHMD
ncbi:MAG TPA: type II secretion system protein GspK [Polyangiaceae bacterium]|jgi:general secretion pathway protein K|nr:type II secretion system protein GspK [Polyangiaceae bacterium]